VNLAAPLDKNPSGVVGGAKWLEENNIKERD